MVKVSDRNSVSKCWVLFLFIPIITISQEIPENSWQSSKVYYDSSNKLVYSSDEQKNRIPDFSYAGYKNSEESIPNIPVVKSIKPIDGDNTAHIQKAINELGSMPLNKDGFRGTLLLKAGSYNVYGTVYLNHSGVVLRGEGDGRDSSVNTVINGVGDAPSNRTILIAGGGNGDMAWKDWEWGTRSFISSEFVQVGSNEFEVENVALYKVGDNIIINHPCTKKWLEANEWGVNNDVSKFWFEGEMPILYNRYIKKIEGNKITIDVPVYNHLDKKLSQSFIYKPRKVDLLTNIGIENLRIDIHTLGRTDIKNHAESAIGLFQIEDAWVKGCTMTHFWKSGVVTRTASKVSIINCKALEPFGAIKGGQRYNFNVSTASQQILFYHCNSVDARHAYVSNGRATVSGIAVVECTSERSYTTSEGHQKWSQGMLFDNLVETVTRKKNEGGNRVMGFYNRGNWANGHGWSTAHSVLWNCDANGKTIVVQKPPTAQNYAIGCFGQVSGERPHAPFDGPEGHIEGSNKKGLYPESLFKAQYKERMGVEFTTIHKKNKNN